MILQKICYNRNKICDSDNITAVMTTDNKTHKPSLYNRCRCLLLFSAVAICSTSFMLIKMEATFEMANRK